MNPNERIIRTLEGKSVDRVPTFCATLEDRTFNEVLGKPLIPQEWFFRNRLTVYLLDKWGPSLTRSVFQPLVNIAMEKRIKAAVKLGFDSTWAVYEGSFIVLDSKTMARFTGSLFRLQGDGYGNMTYRYSGPGITSREEFEAWPHWPVPDEVAHNAYKFMRKIVRKYGEQICLIGHASAYGLHESLLWTLGVENMALWVMMERDLVQRYINLAEELCLKTSMAMLDAGIRVIMQPDDFAFKSGPFLNPKLIDELFGPPYKRIIKAVHDRGGKFLLHSCGDNTLLFDIFLSWGVDGFHAYENTSNVNIVKEKEIHGDRAVMIGGMGIDYLLTDRSRDDEVVEQVKTLIRDLAPGGRFIIAPTHSISATPAHKLKVMIDAVKKYGSYPLNLS